MCNVYDNMVLTIHRVAVVNAGQDRAICQNSQYHFTDATASNFSAILWTHNGLGTLASANTLTPTYTPAPTETGIVTFTLSANGLLPCENASDQKTLTIHPTPTAIAGPDFNNCDRAPFVLTSAMASGASSINWTTSGTGTFVNPTMKNAHYTQSAAKVTFS